MATARSGTLTEKKCTPCSGDTPPLDEAEAEQLLAQVEAWEQHNGAIERTFEFDDFHQTMSFVNAVAWIANRQNHHPDLEVGYARCKVRFSTHAIDGLSQNDFICAAKVNALLEES